MKSLNLEVMVGRFTATMTPLAASAALPDQDRMPASMAVQLADAAFARSEWKSAIGHYLSALASGSAVVDVRRCLMHGARCALYLGEFQAAQALLTTYRDYFPEDAEGVFYLGRAYQAAHRDFDALGCYNAASLLAPNKPRYLVAIAQAAHSLAFSGFGYAGDTMPATYLSIARTALAAALAKDADFYDALIEEMHIALDTGDADRAIAICKAIAGKPDKHPPARVTSAVRKLGLALLRGGRPELVAKLKQLEGFPAGRVLLERARETRRDPAPRPKGSVVSYLSRQPGIGRWGLETVTTGKLRWPQQADPVPSASDSVSLACDYVVPVRGSSRGALMGIIAQADALPGHFAGVVRLAAESPSRRPTLDDVEHLVIRKRHWDELVASHPDADWDGLAALALARLRLQQLARSEAPVRRLEARPAKSAKPRVLVLSRHGPRLFGGVEQFLQIASRFYARNQGVEVFFSGLTMDLLEAATTWPEMGRGLSSGFIHEDAAAIRSFVLRNGVDTIHISSGLGEIVLEAIDGLGVKLVYGVHFWREFIPARILSRFYYPDVSMEDAKPLPLMEDIIARADYTYVNSDFCADMSRTAYGWSPPVIHSVPVPGEDDSPPPPDPQIATLPMNFALLVNARADKGWLLLLDIAERLPHRDFVAIAGQSDRDAARMDLHRRGLRNVMVIGRTDAMDALYAAARVVLVPSYSFVETFSRVTIEAGRARRPVLLADSGNLAYLGAGTGLVLPNDADAWVERVDAIMGSDAAYETAAAEAASIAERHSAKNLRQNLRRIPIHTDAPRLLVCVGSGLGNICHTTPMIRKLADHFDAAVDVYVAGDFGGSAAAMAGAPAVGQVFENLRHVLDRRYDLVLVTHCFGTAIPPFNAAHVIASRDLMMFEAGGTIHESAFNLAFLDRATGIASTERDARNYFFGGLAPHRLREARPLRIGLHAGSKGGIWASKRWPGFAALAARLMAEGTEVVSVGIAEEYVEGTVDKTGLTIARMAEEISACDGIVTNDSGIMNVANAIGVPIVAIFAPTNPVTRGPINSPVRVLAPETSCSPCEANPRTKGRFERGECRCISLIGVDRVLGALDELGLREQPQAPAVATTTVRRRA